MNTSPRFQLFKASEMDEERLKKLYSEKSRDGAIQINLDRCPNFLEALQVEGFENGVFAVEDSHTGIVAGAGIRNIRNCHINGKITKIGYLSGLRVASNYQKSRAMAMIFIKLRNLYLQGECSAYLCSVFKSNKSAIQILTSGKAGMPMFKTIGTYNTFVFKPTSISAKKMMDITIRQAVENDIDKLVTFLNFEGQKQQFFPHYTKNHFIHNSGLLKNLNITDCYIALKNDNIIGCMALWDQTSFRRWKIEGYSKSLHIFRPFLNGIFSILNLPTLPKVHSNFNYRFLSLVCIQNNSIDVFANLYNHLVRSEKGKDNILLSASFFDNSPFTAALPKFRFTFKSTILLGYWKESQAVIDDIDQRIPYIEAGSL